MKQLLRKICLLMLLGTLTACGSGGGSVGTSTGNPTYFPAGLAVASPFDTTEASSGNINTNTLIKAQSGSFISRYSEATTLINTILNGSTASSCSFDPEFFITQGTDADCYGPTVAYEAHPDASGPGDPNYDGTLPPGDVGMWSETDNETGHACAAAQLNARLESMDERSLGALMGLASLVCTANVNSLSLPSNSSLDLTTEINSLGITNTTFNTASIAHSNSSGSDQWSYELVFTFILESDSFDITALLTHIPGSTTNTYQGRLTTMVNDTMDPAGGCPSINQTYNGSLLYNKTAADNFNVEVMEANFCEHDSDGTTDGLVDPAKKYNGGADSDGWANNFSIFITDFDPTSLEGNYAYSWQAGDQDQYTRVLNAVVTEDEDSSDLSGEAFYGFGDDVEETDGAITGFFCNWAGPNGSFNTGENFQTLAQNQTMSLNDTSGKFDADSSSITYAPTNSCNYDGLGTFTYDSDANGTVDTNPATTIPNDLVSLTDIGSSEFTLPTTPTNI